MPFIFEAGENICPRFLLLEIGTFAPLPVYDRGIRTCGPVIRLLGLGKQAFSCYWDTILGLMRYRVEAITD